MSTTRVTFDIPSHLLEEFCRNPDAYRERFIELLQSGLRSSPPPAFRLSHAGSKVAVMGRLRPRGPDAEHLAAQLKHVVLAASCEAPVQELNFTLLSCASISFLETLRHLAKLLPMGKPPLVVLYSRSDWNMVLAAHEKEFSEQFHFLYEPSGLDDPEEEP